MSCPATDACFAVFSRRPWNTLPRLAHFHAAPPILPSLRIPITKTPLLHFCLRSVLETQNNVEITRSQNPETRRKLFVLNLPWSYSVQDIKKLFGECGSVDDVEIIKQKDGKNRGFAFVTMASGEDALAAIQKYDSSELIGRIVRVEFAKRFKRPPPQSMASAEPPSLPTPHPHSHHKVYVSNLAWKVRSNNLREFFSSKFNPISARIVFDSPSGRSAGYGFVSFQTEAEAKSAIAELDGKELFGRAVQLKPSERSLTTIG